METALLDEVAGRTAAIDPLRMDPPNAACLLIWAFIMWMENENVPNEMVDLPVKVWAGS